jgi:hypothetical protein
MTPILKEQWSLKPTDFEHHPVWVRAIDYDREEPWFQEITEQIYRPWDGPLPIDPKSQFPFVLLASSFRFLDGNSYSGYIQPVTEEWDAPVPPRKMKDGSFTETKHWSARHGDTPLSILALHSPVIFIEGKAHDFHLRRDPERRRRDVLDFYAAVGKRPEEVFPVEFSAEPTLFKGIVSGRIDGFYAFPLNRPFEIDRGDLYLTDAV